MTMTVAFDYGSRTEIAHAARRLDLVRELLLRAGAQPVVTALDARGSFRPLTAEEVA